MKKTYCDICREEMDFNPIHNFVKKQKGFSFLDIYVDMGHTLTFKIGAIPSSGHTKEICKECWDTVKVKIARGEFVLSVNHTPVCREAEVTHER